MALTEDVKGDLRSALESLRDELASEIEHGARCKVCGGGLSSPTAPLAKQLRDVLTQLEGMAKPEGSKTDELKKRRARRQAGVQKRASRGEQQRAGGGRASG